jgi:peptidoglycan/xylan/chitin deacetylase (PgdA/CDA1 family)
MKQFLVNFHGIGDPPSHVDAAEHEVWCSVDDFLALLDLISQNSFNPPVSITFDDGNISDAKVALPELKKRGLSATFFVCSGRIGRTGYLDGCALNDLVSAGMELGSHGVDHVDWRSCSPSQLKDEVTQSKHRLEDLCGREIISAGIPFGSYDRRVLGAVRDAGYHHAFTSDGGFAESSLWLQPRNTVKRSWRDKDLIELFLGCSSFHYHLRGLLIRLYKSLR